MHTTLPSARTPVGAPAPPWRGEAHHAPVPSPRRYRNRLFLAPTNRPYRICLPNQKRQKTNPQHRMIQRSPKILPHRSSRPWIVRRQQQRQHVQYSKHASPPHPNSQCQRNPNRQLSISHQKRNGPRVRQNNVPQDRRHERIRPILGNSPPPSPLSMAALTPPPRPTPILGSPLLPPKNRSALRPPFHRSPPKQWWLRSPRPPLRRTHRRRRNPPHPPRKLFRAIRIFRVRLIPPRLPNLRHRPAHCLHQLAWYLRHESRWQRSPHLLLVPKHPPAHCPSQRQRLPCPRHAHVHQPPLLLNPFLLIDRPAVRANPIFHPRQKHVVKLQPLRAVQRDQRHA